MGSGGELYLKLKPRVAEIARAELGAAPPDLVHDISVDIVLSLPRYRGDCLFTRWAQVIALRDIDRWLRTQARRARLLQEVSTRSTRWEAMRPDDAAEARLLIGRIQHSQDRFSEREWACLLLVCFEHQSVRAVAAELGISLEAVRMNICRARRRLRTYLGAQP